MPTTSTESRRGWLRLMGGLAAAAGLPAVASAHGTVPLVEVWRDPGCGCCELWVKHLRDNLFVVQVRDLEDLAPLRESLGMPQSLASCHTARIEGYVIEGHVPASEIHRLLRERPKALGLAVPEMPRGSPGMEQGGTKDPFDVLLVARDGSTSAFKSYR